MRSLGIGASVLEVSSGQLAARVVRLERIDREKKKDPTVWVGRGVGPPMRRSSDDRAHPAFEYAFSSCVQYSPRL